MTQGHVLRSIVFVQREQATAARTKQHEDKHTGIRTEEKKGKKQGKKSRNIVIKASTETKLPAPLLPGPVGYLITRLAIVFLLSSTAVSSVSTSDVDPPPP